MEKKRLIATVGAMALTAAIAVTSTLAYLSFVSDQKVNKFTSGNTNVSGDLTESEWDFADDTWSNYLPGSSTGKNPKVEIAADSEDAYIAIKVVCVDSKGDEMSLADFTDNYATVSFNSVNGINPAFTRYASTDLYIYNTPVTKGTASPELFDSVTINTGIKKVYGTKTSTETIVTYKVDKDGNKIEGSRKEQIGGQVVVDETQKVYIVTDKGEESVDKDVKLPSFEIKVTGYAVQAENTGSEYTSLLADLAGVK